MYIIQELFKEKLLFQGGFLTISNTFRQTHVVDGTRSSYSRDFPNARGTWFINECQGNERTMIKLLESTKF